MNLISSDVTEPQHCGSLCVYKGGWCARHCLLSSGLSGPTMTVLYMCTRSYMKKIMEGPNKPAIPSSHQQGIRITCLAHHPGFVATSGACRDCVCDGFCMQIHVAVVRIIMYMYMYM